MTADSLQPTPSIRSDRGFFRYEIWQIFKAIFWSPSEETFSRYQEVARMGRAAVLLLFYWLLELLGSKSEFEFLINFFYNLAWPFGVAAVFYGVAKLSGGTGNYTRTFFMVALILLYVKFWMMGWQLLGLLGAIVFGGTVLGKPVLIIGLVGVFMLIIYQQVLFTLSMAAVHRLTFKQSVRVISIPLMVTIILAMMPFLNG